MDEMKTPGGGIRRKKSRWVLIKKRQRFPPPSYIHILPNKAGEKRGFVQEEESKVCFEQECPVNRYGTLSPRLCKYLN